MTNDYEIHGGMTKVFINKRGPKRQKSEVFFIIDTVDLPRLLAVDGSFVRKGKGHSKLGSCIHLIRNNEVGKLSTTTILSFLLPQGVFGVYRDGDMFNVRRSNIYVADKSEVNQRKYGLDVKNKSGYRNVSWCKKDGKWKVLVRVGRHIKYEGLFDDVHKAGAYAKRMREEFMPASCEQEVVI